VFTLDVNSGKRIITSFVQFTKTSVGTESIIFFSIDDFLGLKLKLTFSLVGNPLSNLQASAFSIFFQRPAIHN